MLSHRQVRIRGIEVDELLAPILAKLWDVPIRTEYSCQGNAWLPSGVVIERGYIAYDAMDHEAMSHELPRLIDGPLDWELTDPWEKKFQRMRPGGTLWCVRFPPLKADHHGLSRNSSTHSRG